MKQGKIFFISGPSGVGKGTVIDYLRKKYKHWIFPPSCTTRIPRPGEVDGETYFFVSREVFQQKIEKKEFLEYAQVHGGNLYGTLKAPLIEGVKNGNTVVREFDVQGFLQARETLPKSYYKSIFLKPDKGIETLIQRIRKRSPMADEEINCRMKSMIHEMQFESEYDHVIVSEQGKVKKMIQDVESIISEYSDNSL
jgi:guanylate kinase